MMLQQDKAGDYVLATNETHTVREVVEAAFGKLGIVNVVDPRGIADTVPADQSMDLVSLL